MKKLIVICVILLMSAESVFAFTIKTKDIEVYEYKEGKVIGKGVPTTIDFVVDIEQRLIVEESAVAAQKGKRIDTTQLFSIPYYQIVAEENGRLIGAKLAGAAFDTIDFLPDGTYTMVSSQYNPEVPTTGAVVGGHYVIVAFGTYTVEE